MSKSNSKNQKMGELQKRALLTLGICALVILITAIVVSVFVKKGKEQKEAEEVITEEYSKDAYAINQESEAILTLSEPVDMSEVLFIGDSNTVRMNNYGIITYQQAAAKVGIGIREVSADAFLYFEQDDRAHTIVDSLRLRLMNPTQIIICLGTNNVGNMNVFEFIDYYKSALAALSLSDPYARISVAAIPPIPADHSKYPDMKQLVIDQFNQALLEMCEEEGYSFLNSTEALKGTNGFGQSKYFDQSDIHMNMEGLETLYRYYETHLGEIEDQRPNDRYAVRVEPPHSEQPEPTATEAPSATPDEKGDKEFTANYYAESNGYVQFGEQKSTTLNFDVTPTTKLTVTAVPKTGYSFYKWSDGVETAVRIDEGFTQNFSVTAIFNETKTELKLSQTSATIARGEKLTLEATLTVDGVKQDAKLIHWVLGTQKVSEGASYTYTGAEASEATIVAVAEINGTSRQAECKVTIKQPISLTLDTESVTVEQGKSVTINAITNGDSSKVKWSNGAPDGGSCVFSASNPGTYTLVANLEGVEARCTITVKAAEATPAPPPTPEETQEPNPAPEETQEPTAAPPVITPTPENTEPAEGGEQQG